MKTAKEAFDEGIAWLKSEGWNFPESTNPVKVIRRKCLECVNGSPQEVSLCPSTRCPNWPYREGKNPFRKPGKYHGGGGLNR